VDHLFAKHIATPKEPQTKQERWQGTPKKISNHHNEEGALGILQQTSLGNEDRAVLVQCLQNANSVWKQVKPEYDLTGSERGRKVRQRLSLASCLADYPLLKELLGELERSVQQVSHMLTMSDKYQHLTYAANVIFILAVPEPHVSSSEQALQCAIHRDHTVMDSPQAVTVELLLNDVNSNNGSVKFWPYSTKTPLEPNHINR
jgi:hypothetical protein